jgi:hypothetical protein
MEWLRQRQDWATAGLEVGSEKNDQYLAITLIGTRSLRCNRRI